MIEEKMTAALGIALVISVAFMFWAIEQCEDKHECSQNAMVGMAIGFAAGK